MDTSHIAAVAGPSGTTVITVDANGENTIVYSAGSNGEVSVDYVQQSSDALVAADVLGLCLESPMETVTACARLCHDAGLKVLLNDSPFVAELPAELIEASDILLVNEHEMAQLLGIAEPDDDDWDGLDWSDVARQMHDFGFNQAVITLGGDGSVVIDGDDIYRIAPVAVEAIDTTGCERWAVEEYELVLAVVARRITLHRLLEGIVLIPIVKNGLLHLGEAGVRRHVCGLAALVRLGIYVFAHRKSPSCTVHWSYRSIIGGD